MSTRPINILILVSLMAGLSGCANTGAAKQARAQARHRLNIINAELAYDQAEQALLTGQFDKASDEIRKSIALHHEWAPYRVIQGRIYLETHRLERALESFDRAIELKPDYAEAYYLSGVVFQRWSDDAKAYDRYSEAWELESDNVAYLLAAAESMVALEQFELAKGLIESKVAYFEHNSAMHHLLGKIAMLQDDVEEAADLYSEAWRLNPEDDTLLEELALAQYSAEQYGKCHRSVKQLQDLAGVDRFDLRHLEARCLVHLERQVDARNLYLKLTREEPTDVNLWIELGTIAWELGDFHRTALSGARVTALAPERYEGYLLKGINERHHGNIKDAIAFLGEAAYRADEVALPHLVLGRVLEEQGDSEGAMIAYAQAIRVEPESHDAQALYFDGQDRLLADHPDASPE